MPLVNAHTFYQRHAGPSAKPTEAFRWVDDPVEDAAFATAMEYSPSRVNMTVDRSGPAPVLRWKDGNNNPFSANIGASGVLWHKAPYNSPSGTYSVAPGPLPTGYWECDQYGRPYDLNDLQA